MPKRSVSRNSSTWRPAKSSGFGALLREHRVKAGYSQSYLAEKARVSLETIGALERGTRRAPYPDTLNLLIGALELSGAQRTGLETAAVAARKQSVMDGRDTSEDAHNLPAQLTPLIGREDEVVRLAALLAEHRLVTVTGRSGVGKTRVALETATRLARTGSGEVRLVDLAALPGDASVPDTIASIVGAPRSYCKTARGLAGALKGRKMLLVIDHGEHLITEVSAVAQQLLQTCPHIRIVAASCERLGVAGEALFRLPPLALPDEVPQSIQEARRFSALALFIQRAESEARFVADAANLQRILEICRRLDGLPRPLELAAARLSAMSLRDLHSRLSTPLVLTGGGRDLPVRQQRPLEALRVAYDGLVDVERLLFRRLAAFAAGLTLEDAAAIFRDDAALSETHIAVILDVLVDKSLVTVARCDGRASYSVVDFARSFGSEELTDSGECGQVSERYRQ